MKSLIEKRIFPILIIAVALFLFFGEFLSKRTSEDRKTDVRTGNINSDPVSTRAHERVVYICRLAEEEIPAVQISEAVDENGRVAYTVARAAIGTGIEIIVPDAAPTWDYKSVSARSGDASIEVAYEFDGSYDDYEWVLRLIDQDVSLMKRVKDCTEVSDE